MQANLRRGQSPRPLLWAIAAGLGVTAAVGGSSAPSAQALLPNAQQQFLDFNGTPLAGGFVYMYVPGTTTPSATWQNQALTVANTNPIQLDAAGEARIWSNGSSYRQVVTKADGSLVWDQVTTASVGTVRGPASVLHDDLVSWNGNSGTLLADSGISASGGNIVMSGTITSGAISVTGAITATGTITGANLTTAGAITAGSGSISGNLSVGGVATFASFGTTGNGGVGGNFSVNGNTTLDGTLAVLGFTSIASLTVTGIAALPGLPTLDPHVVGELWNNAGVVTVSAG